jgi:hypothetical protein
MQSFSFPYIMQCWGSATFWCGVPDPFPSFLYFYSRSLATVFFEQIRIRFLPFFIFTAEA